MTWREFEVAERNILAEAPAAHWRRIEMRLRLARELLASGVNVAADVAALQREVAAVWNDTSKSDA
jgi:hypothetical protein